MSAKTQKAVHLWGPPGAPGYHSALGASGRKVQSGGNVGSQKTSVPGRGPGTQLAVSWEWEWGWVGLRSRKEGTDPYLPLPICLGHCPVQNSFSAPQPLSLSSSDMSGCN